MWFVLLVAAVGLGGAPGLWLWVVAYMAATIIREIRNA